MSLEILRILLLLTAKMMMVSCIIASLTYSSFNKTSAEAASGNNCAVLHIFILCSEVFYVYVFYSIANHPYSQSSRPVFHLQINHVTTISHADYVSTLKAKQPSSMVRRHFWNRTTEIATMAVLSVWGEDEGESDMPYKWESWDTMTSDMTIEVICSIMPFLLPSFSVLDFSSSWRSSYQTHPSACDVVVPCVDTFVHFAQSSPNLGYLCLHARLGFRDARRWLLQLSRWTRNWPLRLTGNQLMNAVLLKFFSAKDSPRDPDDLKITYSFENCHTCPWLKNWPLQHIKI